MERGGDGARMELVGVEWDGMEVGEGEAEGGEGKVVGGDVEVCEHGGVGVSRRSCRGHWGSSSERTEDRGPDVKLSPTKS